MHEITLWYVFGVAGEYFTTKLAAEVRARQAFPDESPRNHYGRVRFKTFFTDVYTAAFTKT